MATMAELRGAMSVLDEILEKSKEFNKQRMEAYGLTDDFCRFVGSLSDEAIQGLTLAEINSHMKQFDMDSTKVLQQFQKDDNSVSTLDKWKTFYTELRAAILDMDMSQNTRDELKQACNDVYSAQLDFIKSAEYREAYDKKVEMVRQKAEQEPDAAVRKNYLRKLDAVKKSKDLSFLLERLDDPKINKKNPNKELERLVEIFFDRDRSVYLMDRYITVSKKLGLTAEYHVNLYDLEEKFLPEYFYPLNNFFLFLAMSYIAYIDPNNDVEYLYAITVLSMMGNLFRGELSKKETDILLGVVRNVENRILVNDSMVERFKRDNSTWKEHPVRKELDAKREEMRYRTELIAEIVGYMKAQKNAVNLIDGVKLTTLNAPNLLKQMATTSIEGIRDEVKSEAERRKAERIHPENSVDGNYAVDTEEEEADMEENDDDSDTADLTDDTMGDEIDADDKSSEHASEG